jgi:hypothetical protein
MVVVNGMAVAEKLYTTSYSAAAKAPMKLSTASPSIAKVTVTT